MGSTYIEIDPAKGGGPLGVFKNKTPQIIWLQWVPATVRDVVHNSLEERVRVLEERLDKLLEVLKGIHPSKSHFGTAI